MRADIDKEVTDEVSFQQFTMPNTTKNNGGGAGKQTSRYQGKQKRFRAPISGLEEVVFHPSSSAAEFKKYDDRLANYFGVSFKYFGPQMSKAVHKLEKPIFVLPEQTDLDSKS